MTKMLSVGDRVRVIGNGPRSEALVSGITWTGVPCTAAPWWASHGLLVRLDNGTVVNAARLVPA